MSERFIGLTLPDGERVWIGVAWVQAVRGVTAGEKVTFGDKVRAMVIMSSLAQGVRETADEVYDELCNVPYLLRGGSSS